MLLVVVRKGAEPTFVGGGELARDIEAEVIEALSDTASLIGLLGRSSLETDARLAWREGGKVGGNIEVTEVGVALPALGVSVFGVDVTRRLLVTFRARGD
jgi:xanthine/CO dehydrogenase XdhC/CoxF family maturation factor